MSEMVVLVNNTLEQRSFRLRAKAGKKRQTVHDGLLVVVPGRDPVTGEKGLSDPIPKELLQAEADSPWLTRLFEDGILSYQQVT